MHCGDFYLFTLLKESPFSWLESFSAGIFFPYSLLKSYEEKWGSASQHSSNHVRNSSNYNVSGSDIKLEERGAHSRNLWNQVRPTCETYLREVTL